jgi:aminoglycoside-2''-adenylyltransferase
MSTETEQLAALARLHEQLERHGIEYWLFGGWAVDFHAGSVTRPHDDLDIAVGCVLGRRKAERVASAGPQTPPA